MEFADVALSAPARHRCRLCQRPTQYGELPSLGSHRQICPKCRSLMRWIFRANRRHGEPAVQAIASALELDLTHARFTATLLHMPAGESDGAFSQRPEWTSDNEWNVKRRVREIAEAFPSVPPNNLKPNVT